MLNKMKNMKKKKKSERIKSDLDKNNQEEDYQKKQHRMWHKRQTEQKTTKTEPDTILPKLQWSGTENSHPSLSWRWRKGEPCAERDRRRRQRNMELIRRMPQQWLFSSDLDGISRLEEKGRKHHPDCLRVFLPPERTRKWQRNLNTKYRAHSFSNKKKKP